MAVENVIDDNYSVFLEHQYAALILSTTTCHVCEEYRPVIDTVSKSFPGVRFGDAVLDKGHLIKIKRQFADIIRQGVPAIILFSGGHPFYYFMGGLDQYTATVTLTTAFDVLAQIFQFAQEEK